ASGQWTDTVAFSPDSKHLATAIDAAGGTESAIMVWEVATAKKVWRIDVPHGRLSALAYTPDGKTLAGVYNDTVGLWNMSTGGGPNRLRGHRDEIEQMAISSDGKLLATASRDRTVRVWSLPGAVEIRRLQGELKLAPDLSELLGRAGAIAAKQRGIV